MSVLPKVFIGMASATATSVAGLSAYKFFYASSFKEKSFEELLRGTILGLGGNSDQTRWQNRLDKLKKNRDSLVNSLSVIVGKSSPDATWSDVQSWCKNNLMEKLSKENEKLFDNVQTYCTFNIGDKLTNKISSETAESDDKWKKVHDKLKASHDNISDSILLAAKNTENTSNAGNKAIKDWCTSVYENPYKLEDTTFKNAEQYCIQIT